MRYRRIYIAGGTYFFTVVAAGRKPIFQDPGAIDLLRGSFARVRQAHPFHVDAICILPDHLHCLWTLPDGDHDFSTRWRLIKAGFSRSFDTGTGRSPWQKRFWEHLIRDEDDYGKHADYIHYNPVKHGLVERPSDWPYSSFGKWVKNGIYPADWGSSYIAPDGVGRE